MLIPKLEPSDKGVFVGGSANSLLSLIQGFGNGATVKVVTSLPQKIMRTFKQYQPEGGGFVILRNDSRPQSTMFGLVYLAKSALWALFLGRDRYDVVHGHSGYAIYAWATYFVGTILRCRRVHTIYCPIHQNSTVEGREKVVLKGRIALFALNQMDKVVAMSKNIADSLVDAGVKREKVVIMPTAINTQKFRPRDDERESVRERLGLISGQPTILFVGNLMRSKGLDVLVDAVGELVRHISNVRLIITLELKHSGFDERQDQILERINLLNIRENIVELGIIEYMPELLSFADVVVSPYRDTQGPSDYPLSIMEAMASSRCVVGTKVGGIPELISDRITGRLVEPDNAFELAGVLRELLMAPDIRSSYGNAARQHIIDNYSQDIVSAAHVKMYEHI